MRPTVGEHDALGRAVAAEHTILQVTVGSTLHGLALGGADDRDEMGVVIEPPELALGTRRFEHWVFRTQPEGVRSGPGDLDLSVYALHKYARLVLQGNPTMMLPLYAPDADCVLLTPLGRELRSNAALFASRKVGERFLGYLRAQKERLLGERGQMRVNRPELIEAHGHDTKYAGHVIRLGYQGVEFLETGGLSLPMQEPMRSYILSVRRGEVTLDEVKRRAVELEEKLEQLLKETTLPKEPDYEAANRFIASLYVRHWQEQGLA
jgi:predicted nucleotidyltransferase